MAGYSLIDIQCSMKPYRLDRDTRRDDGVIKFRDVDSERKQNIYRIKCLSNTTDLTPWEADQAEDLAARLQKEIDTGVPAETLASAVFHRQLRMPILEAVWKLVEDPKHQPCGFVTLHRRNGLYEADELHAVRPADLMKRLRNDFDRSGVTAAKGFGFFGLDSEFDANRYGGVWDFHYHGMVGGEKLLALEALRDRLSYKKGRGHPLEIGLKAIDRVQVQQNLYDLPNPITYCLEGWVPHRPTSVLPDGTLERSASKSVIPSPDLQRWLLWMDRQWLDDFVLLSNLTPTPSGFRLIRP